MPGITELAIDYFMHRQIATQKFPYKDIVQAGVDVGEDRLQNYSASYAILRPHHEAAACRAGTARQASGRRP